MVGNPHDYAVLVGINNYAPGIRTLKGAINDCDLFERWLVSAQGGDIDPANLRRFDSPDPFQRRPIRSDIEDALSDFFDAYDNDPLTPRRRLYMFFSGHGVAPSAQEMSGTSIIMGDARPQLLRGMKCVPAATAMRLTQIFHQVVLVVDCCAEVVGQPELELYLPRYGDPTVASGAFIHIQPAWSTPTIEKELPDPFDSSGQTKLVHGVLTNALLRALMSAADSNGVITAASVKSFIEASDAGTPLVDIGDGGLVPIADMTFGAPIGMTVTVTLEAGTARFQVRDGSNFGVVIPPRAGSDTIRLAPGMYLLDGLDAAGMFTGTQQLTVREGGQSVSI